MSRDEDVEESQGDGYRIDSQLISDLWIFRTVARNVSITAAARRLGVTQGAVSQRILRLESRLGRPLFSRERGRLALTELGAGLLGSMNQVALVLNERLSRLEPGAKRAIVVSCVPSFATEWLAPRLTDLFEQHPDIEVFLRAEMLTLTAERMEDDNIDVAIAYEAQEIPDLYELGAVEERVFPVCSPRYRAHLDKIDRARWNIVRLHDQSPWSGAAPDAEWDAWLRTAPAPWRTAYTSDRSFNLATLAYHAAVCDQGVAMGRSVVVHRLLSRGELTTPGLVQSAPSATYRVLARRPGKPGSAVRRFAAWLCEALTETRREASLLIGATDAS